MRNQQLSRSNQKYPQKSEIICNYCKKPGHTITNCNIGLNKQQSQNSGKKRSPQYECTQESIKHEPEASTSKDQLDIKISVSKPSTIPSIVICAEGAGRNMIKQNSVNPNMSIDEKIVLKLAGINNVPLFTMGQVQINILRYPTILNIIF